MKNVPLFTSLDSLVIYHTSFGDDVRELSNIKIASNRIS
jgi:hypothetical protein